MLNLVQARSTRSIHRSILCAFAAFIVVACVITARPASAEPLADYNIIHTSTKFVSYNLVRTVSKVQVGANPINRFFMYRIRKLGAACDHEGTLLLLPPVSIGFQNYERDENGKIDDSFAAYFARRGYDVWGISLRVEGLEAGTCESGAVDCSAMATWDLGTLVDDATFARSRIALAHPGEAPAIGGLSLGSIGALAVINEHANDYAGVFLMEGTLYNADPAERAIAQGFCDGLEQTLAAGVYYDGQSLPGLRQLGEAALGSPNGSAASKGFPGASNYQAFATVMTTPQVGPLTPRPGYRFLDGNAATGKLTFADKGYILRNVSNFVAYTSLPLVRDIDCGLAGEMTYTDALHNYDGPLFVLAAGNGFGPAMLDTADLMPDADVTLRSYPDQGHVDAYFAKQHRHYTERPLLKWLRHQVF